MAIPILNLWKKYFYENRDEGLGSSYERVVLNNKLQEICKRFGVQSILEAPVFGFTGLSGINSLYMAQQECRVSIIDHDKDRLELIESVWNEARQSVDAKYTEDYSQLPYPDNAFDLSWNFSALWFVQDLTKFLQELTRVSSKAIMLCIPNRAGLGYITQKYFGKDDLKKYLKEEYILPDNFCSQMKSLKWELIDNDFIDCPPWPDIGMPKKKFLAKFGLQWLLKEQSEPKEPLTIMDFYLGNDSNFPQRMMKHYWFEKNAPLIIKRLWAHHRYFIFIPT